MSSHSRNEFGSISAAALSLFHVDSNGNKINKVILDSSGTLNLLTNQFYSCNDRKLKKYIRPLDSTLDAVLNLNPVTFQWRAPHENTAKSNNCYGFIADEIQTVFPNLVLDGGVTEDALPDNLLHIAYIELIPILTKAIQELSVRVAALEA